MSLKFRQRMALVALLATACGFSACQDAREKIQGWIQNLAQTQQLRSASSANDPVLAKVGSDEIRASDFIDYLHYRRSMPQLPAFRQDRMQILRDLIYIREYSQLARAAGIPRDPAYQAAMRREVEKQLQKVYMDRLLSEIKVSSSDVRAYYDSHPREFTQGVIDASHIVTKTFEEAGKAREQLNKGVPFNVVAKAFSIDKKSAGTGGRMPPIHTDQVAPEFERVFATLKPGQISGIVKTSAGFELIQKDVDVTGPLKPFASVQDSILTQLISQVFGKRVEAAKSSIPVVIDEVAVKSLKLPTP